MKKYLISCICMVLLSGLPWTAAGAAEAQQKGPAAIAKVIASLGKVTAKLKEAPVRELANGSPLYLGDVIKTKSGSKVQIQFIDYTIISIGPKANLTLDAFFFEEGNSGSHCDTSILEGAFKIVGGKISKMAPDQIKINTPSATIGIRGTMGIGSVEPESTTAIFMGGGAISVRGIAMGAPTPGMKSSSPQGPGGPGYLGLQVLTGQPGMGTTTPKGQAPPPPHMFDPQVIFGLMNATAVPGGDGDDGGIEPPAGNVGDDDDDDDGAGALPKLSELFNSPFDYRKLAPGGGGGSNTHDLSARGLSLLVKSFSGEGHNYSLWFTPLGEIAKVTSTAGLVDSPGDYVGAWNWFHNYPTAPIHEGTYDNLPLANLFSDTLVFDGIDHEVNVYQLYDNLGQFTYFLRASAMEMPATMGREVLGISQETSYKFYEMIYAGVPSGDIPENKVLRYGSLGGYSESLGHLFVVNNEPPEQPDTDLGLAAMVVNTGNQRFIGVFGDGEADLGADSHLVFGTVDNGGGLNGHIFKQDEQDLSPDIDNYEADYSSGVISGTMFGSEYQGIGAYANGTGNISHLHPDPSVNVQVITAAFLDQDKTESATPGVLDFNAGWVSGIALDGDNTETSAPTYWHNSAPEGLNLALNESGEGGAQGLVTGSLAAAEYTGAGNATGNSMALILGDAVSEDNSAFVTPDLYVSLVTDGIVDNHTLQADGSYLVAYPLAELENTPWISMGGFSVHYTTESGHERVLPRLLSFFVSGAESEIDEVMYANMRANHVTGSYYGPSLASYISGDTVTRLSGNCDFTVDFNAENFTGNINLADSSATSHHVLATGGAIGRNGFSGPVSSWSINGVTQNLNTATSQVNGSYYGAVSNTTAPAAIGGNFFASHSTGEGGTITGVYAGKSHVPAD